MGKLDIVTDESGNKVVLLPEIIFSNKQNINWDDVEDYLGKYVGELIEIAETRDIIYIGNKFPDEYGGSSYTRKTKGATGADLFEIAPQKEYSNVYMQSNSEIRRGSRPELTENVSNMDDYDIVFVGYPVWWHATPASVNTFLESYDLKGKLIIPFCTSGGSDIDETMPTFLDSCDGLAVYGKKRITGNGEIDNWLQEMEILK